MKVRFALVSAVVALAGCSFQNNYEKEADKITRAVLADDTRAIAAEFDPSMQSQITLVKVAELSQELNDAGKYGGVKENDQNCPPAMHCFDVKFEKRPYREMLQLNDKQKVATWYVHEGAPGTTITH